MGKKFDFQYIVIGSGPAGSAAATMLAKAKKNVALIEDRFFGGTDTNSLNVPFLAALDFAHTFNKLSSFPELKNQDISFNFPTIVAREQKAITNASSNNRQTLEQTGVFCYGGHATLLDAHTISVKDKQFSTTNFILATGSHLKTTEIAGLDTTGYLTPETALRLRRCPSVIAVVGAGSTGCEIASFYAELGAKVILFETANRILPHEDVEASAAISNYFTHKLDVSIQTSSKVTAIGEDEYSKYVVFRYGTAEKMVRVEQIALATGSLPNLDYGLDKAKVKCKNSGIQVNKLFETSVKNIYAIGDCIGGESSTERAYQQGITLATNLIKKTKTPASYRGTTRITNTYLQVATVDMNEEDLMRRDRKYKKAIISFNDITAGKISGPSYGFVKLLADHSNKIIGATIVGPEAGYIGQEISFAIRHQQSAVELASTPHLINSYNQAVKLAAKQLLLKKH